MQISYLLLLVQYVAAYPPSQSNKRAVWTGIATFNQFASQSSTVCGTKSGKGGTYAAAVADLSPNIWKGAPCSGLKDTSQCAGQSPVGGYVPPSCPKTNCGKCYTVTNAGGIGEGSVGGAGKSIVIEVVDACPATNAQNYCKTNVPANQRCEAAGTNMLDIDVSAYQALTGTPFGSGANLNVQITESSSCQVGSAGIEGSSPDGGSTAPDGGSTSPDGSSASPLEGGTSNTTPPPALSNRPGGARTPTSTPSVRPAALSSNRRLPGASELRDTCRNRKKKNKRSKGKKVKKEAIKEAQ